MFMIDHTLIADYSFDVSYLCDGVLAEWLERNHKESFRVPTRPISSPVKP